MQFTKPPKTYHEQLELLISRGMRVDNHARALHYLSHINYYRLAAYWRPFESDHITHQFSPGTTFDEVLEHYVFDRELRLLIMDAVERIEVSIRTTWAYYLAHHYNPHAHLDARIFKSPSSNWNYSSQLNRLHDEFRRNREAFILHYKRHYNEALPPLWVCVEIMTLGQLSKWYGNLKHGADRNAVALQYDMDEVNLCSFLHHLSIIRNYCAHHARLWNRELPFAFKIPKHRPKILAASMNTATKTHRIYNTLAVAAWLMDCINPRHHWKQRLGDLLLRHQNVKLESMGFPKNWQTLPLWNGKV